MVEKVMVRRVKGTWGQRLGDKWFGILGVCDCSPTVGSSMGMFVISLVISFSVLSCVGLWCTFCILPGVGSDPIPTVSLQG